VHVGGSVAPTIGIVTCSSPWICSVAAASITTSEPNNISCWCTTLPFVAKDDKVAVNTGNSSRGVRYCDQRQSSMFGLSSFGVHALACVLCNSLKRSSGLVRRLPRDLASVVRPELRTTSHLKTILARSASE
jgi:hypothetical protein